jgi:hypothetical protein
MSTTRNEYRVDLGNVRDMGAFAGAFNDGLIRAAGGHWHGSNWDAFNDYLSWPVEDSYVLFLDGWSQCTALCDQDKAIFEDVLAANPHVLVKRT